MNRRSRRIAGRHRKANARTANPTCESLTLGGAAPAHGLYAKYIGRVGALAVALGVGAAVATSFGMPIARADDTTNSTDSPSDHSGPADQASSGDSPAPGDQLPDPTPPATHVGADGGASGGSGGDTPPGTGMQLSSSGGQDTSVNDEGQSTDTTAEEPAAQSPTSAPPTAPSTAPPLVEADTIPPVSEAPPKSKTLLAGETSPAPENISVPSAPKGAVEPQDADTTSTDVVPMFSRMSLMSDDDAADSQLFGASGQQANFTSLAPMDAAAQDPLAGLQTAVYGFVGSVVTSIFTALLSPFISTGPTAPAEPPLLLGLLLFVSRELQRGFANNTPNGVVDEVTTSEDTPVVIDAVDNDTDADPGDTLSVASFTQPTHGDVVLNSDGTFTYTPDAGYHGTDSFGYTVTDKQSPYHLHVFGGSHTDTAEVHITVNEAINSAPVVSTSPGSSGFTENGNPVVVDGALTVTDPDSPLTGATITILNGQAGDSLAWTPAGSGITLDPTSTATTLKLTGTASASDYQTALRSVTFATTGDNPATTPRFISFTATDATTASTAATKTVTITAVNDAPVAAGDSATVIEDTPTVITVLGNDTDADNNTLTPIVVGQGTKGSATVNPDGTITYTPTLNATGTDSFTYKVNDGTTDSAPVTVNITITAVNDAPVAAGDSATVIEDTPTVITVLGNDTDADNNTLTPIVVGQGTKGSAAVNPDGTITYTPTLNATGTDSFTYKVNDGTTDSAPVTVNITITAVNDAPVVAIPGNNPTFIENNPAVTIASGLTVTDTDSPTLTGATITITNPKAGDTLVFTPPPGSGISIDPSSTASMLILTGTASTTAYQNALRTIAFANTGEDPQFVVRTISFEVTDGTNPSAPVNRNVNVFPVDDIPVVTPSAGSTSYTENGAPVAVDANLTVTDPDSPTLHTGYVRLENPQDGDVLTWTAPPGITGINVSFVGNSIVGFSGVASIADYQTVLRAVKFSNTSENPSTVDREFTMAVGGPQDASLQALKTLNVVAVNDPPVVTASSGSTSYTENGAPVVVDPNVTVTDIDSPITGAYIQVANRQDGDTLSWTPPPGSAITIDNSFPQPGVLVLTGSASAADYQTALRAIAFSNTSDNPVAGTRSIDFTVFNGATSSTPIAIKSVTVTAVDDPTVLTATPGPTSYTENEAAVAVDPGITISDPDSPTLTGARVLLQHGLFFQESLGRGERLTFTAPADSGITGSYNEASGALILTGTSSVANYQETLRSVKYDVTSDIPPATRGIDFQIMSDTTVVASTSKTVNVTRINDAPTAVGPDGPFATNEDTAITLTRTQLIANDTDPESGAFGLDIYSVDNAINGAVVLNGNGTVTFTPTANYSGPASFTYRVFDGQLVSANSATVNITVNAVNDLPTVTTSSGTTIYTENSAPVTIDPNLTLADPDSPNVTRAVVFISGGQTGDDLNWTPPPNSNISLDPSGNGITTLILTGNATQAEYQSALRSVTFSTAGDRPVAGNRTIGFIVSDAVGQSATAAKVVTVVAVNDAPVAVDDNVTLNEDNPLNIATSTLRSNDTDVDTDINTLTITSVSNPTNGTVVLVNPSTITFTPNANYNGPATFDYTVSDGAGGTDVGTVNLTINAWNDPVDAIADNFTAVEDGGPISGNVLTNDIAQNVDVGETLAVAQVANGTTTKGGTYTLTSNGAFTYTPAANFNGTDTFNYTATDGATSDTAAVTIAVQSVIDNNELVATIPIDSAWHAGSTASHVVFSADGTKAFVANPNEFSVSVINTSSNTVVYTIPVANNPRALAVSGNRLYIATDFASGTAGAVSAYDISSPTYSQIDMTPGGAVDSIVVGRSPAHIAVKPDGSTLYVSGRNASGRGTISVINFNSATGGYTTAATVVLDNGGSPSFSGADATGLVLDNANNKLFILSTRASAASVWILNTATNTLIDTVSGTGADAGITPITVPGTFNPLGLAMVTNVNPSLNRLYLGWNNGSGSGEVWVIDPVTNALVDQGSSVSGIQPITLSGDPTTITSRGSYLYIGQLNGTVSVINTTNNSISTVTLPAGVIPLAVSISPSGDRLYVAGGGPLVNNVGPGAIYVYAIVPAI